MSDVLSQDDITRFVANSVPEHLDNVRLYMSEYLDGVFNHSLLTPRLQDLPNYFNQFETSSISPMLLYDKALSRFSHYDIRNLIAMSLVDSGPGFFTQFFAHFFDRFELYYADSNENRYETLSGVIYTDEGHLTDSQTFTDDGIGVGPYCILASVIFSMVDRATIEAKYIDAYNLLTLMKPARLHVFFIPTLDIRFNQLLSGDPQYVPILVSGTDRYFDLTVISPDRPGQLITDKSPTPWLTEGGITTDAFSIQNYLNGLGLKVKYASAPTNLITLTTKTYAIPKDYGFFFSAEAEISEEVSYIELSGSQVIFNVGVRKPLLLKALNSDGHMRIRVSWNVPFGEGPNA
jgi:hypothetical protein